MIIGSFLNVCIVRIPAEESIVRPRSHCPACQTAIRPLDNIPLLSWLALGGRCRKCRTRISILYPAVEILTGLLFVSVYRIFGITPAGLKWTIFACLVLVLIMTDLRDRVLPDAVTFPGLGLGLALATGTPPMDDAAQLLWGRVAHYIPPLPVLSFTDSVLGAAFGMLLLWTVRKGYFLWRGREGMGQGDIKMMMMVGAFLGVTHTFLTILIGTLLGSIIGLSIIGALYLRGWKRRVAERASRRGMGTISALRYALASKYQLPFGTFLGTGALLVVFFGTSALEWYFSVSSGR
jgi:leader peptidase (prepilin peptidase)/N-methyltransferase